MHYAISRQAFECSSNGHYKSLKATTEGSEVRSSTSIRYSVMRSSSTMDYISRSFGTRVHLMIRQDCLPSISVASEAKCLLVPGPLVLGCLYLIEVFGIARQCLHLFRWPGVGMAVSRPIRVFGGSPLRTSVSRGSQSSSATEETYGDVNVTSALVIGGHPSIRCLERVNGPTRDSSQDSS